MTPPSIADVLSRAADLIEPEGRWIQKRGYARDESGHPCLPYKTEATCFCAAGAIICAAGAWSDDAVNAIDLAAEVAGGERDEAALVDFNDEDGRTQAEVVAKLREAAAKAREQGL